MREYVMDCLKAGSIKMLSVDARGDKVGVSVDIEVPFGECEEALAEAGMKGARAGEILAKVVADSKKFDEAWERVEAVIRGEPFWAFPGPHVNCPCVMPEPHTCPTCDDYGYVNVIIFSDKPTERRDIPCPDCEAE